MLPSRFYCLFRNSQAVSNKLKRESRPRQSRAQGQWGDHAFRIHKDIFLKLIKLISSNIGFANSANELSSQIRRYKDVCTKNIT